MMEPVYPAPVHQDGTMDLDVKIKRVPFIEGSTEITVQSKHY